MISVEEALEHIRSNRPELGDELISIQDALGRILSEDVIASLNMPPFTSANMDGYAVADCKARYPLNIIGYSAAGHPFAGKVRMGEAVRISTGAMIPSGADRVLIKENATEGQDKVIVRIAPKKGTHIRPLGSDFKTGETLLKAGQILRVADLTICAAAGITKLLVLKKLTLALLSCGDELVPAEKDLQTGQIYAANTVGLAALLRSWSVEVTIFDPVKDTADSISSVLSKLSNFDIIVPIGGASVGDHDLMRPSFKAAGFKLLFEKVPLRPGKPCWMGRRDEQIVLGLPGNPASVFVCTQIFLRALLNLEIAFLSASLTEPIDENGPRETYLRASTEIRDGNIFVTPFAQQDSYRHRPQAEATALIKLAPMGGPFRSGDKIDILLLGDLAQAR